MSNTNQQSSNTRIGVAPRQAGRLIIGQVQNSMYSKGGRTTLTGKFEAIPKNQWASSNKDLIDSIANTKSNTYLQSLKNRNKSL